MREHATTVFGEMSALAVATASVNLGQGFPDTDGPQVVKDAAIRAIQEGRGNQYPPAHGVPESAAGGGDGTRAARVGGGGAGATFRAPGPWAFCSASIVSSR